MCFAYELFSSRLEPNIPSPHSVACPSCDTLWIGIWIFEAKQLIENWRLLSFLLYGDLRKEEVSWVISSKVSGILLSHWTGPIEAAWAPIYLSGVYALEMAHFLHCSCFSWKRIVHENEAHPYRTSNSTEDTAGTYSLFWWAIIVAPWM